MIQKALNPLAFARFTVMLTDFCIVKGKGGVNASLMSFGGTGSHKYVVVRLIEITHNMDITPLE